MITVSAYFLYIFSQTVELKVVYDLFTFNYKLFNQSSLVEVSKKIKNMSHGLRMTKNFETYQITYKSQSIKHLNLCIWYDFI